MSKIFSLLEESKCQGEKWRQERGIERAGSRVGKRLNVKWNDQRRAHWLTFEQRPEESKRPSSSATWGKRIPDRGNRKCKGPEAETWVGGLGKSKEAEEAGGKRAWERVLENKIGEVMVGVDCALRVIVRLLTFPLREKRSHWTVLSGKRSWYDDRFNRFALAALLETDYNSDEMVVTSTRMRVVKVVSSRQVPGGKRHRNFHKGLQRGSSNILRDFPMFEGTCSAI